MLSNIHNLFDVDSIFISDGSSLQIPGIRDYRIKEKKNTLSFYNVLLVPNLTKILLLISQLPTQFLVNYKFSNVDYCIKDNKQDNR